MPRLFQILRRRALARGVACSMSLALASGHAWAQLAELMRFPDPRVPGIDSFLFGHALSLSGDWMVVTDPSASSPGSPSSIGGTAHVFRRVGASWEHTQSLTGDPSSLFGNAVSIDGTRLAVAAQFWGAAGNVSDDTGRVYLYEQQGSSWILAEELGPGNQACGDTAAFGTTIALSGDVLAVGLRNCDMPITFPQQLRVYERSPSGNWDHVDTFRMRRGGPLGSPGGRGLAADGDLIVAGTNDSVGSAVVLRRGPEGWYRSAWLVDPVAITGDELGGAVAVDGDTIVLGAPTRSFGDNFVYEGGYALVFERTGVDRWTKVQRIEPTDPVIGTSFGGQFGVSVAVDGDEIAVGAGLAATVGPMTGTVYYYKKGPTGWPRYQTERFVSSHPVSGDRVGQPVAMEGGIILSTAQELSAVVGLGEAVLEWRPRYGYPYCTALPNSTLEPSTLTAHGTDVAAAERTNFLVRNLPPGTAGGLAVSTIKTLDRPVFNGNLCLGPAIRRLGRTTHADAHGRVQVEVDSSQLGPLWMRGTTLHFQYWHEDTVGVGFSNALELTLQ